MMPLRFFKFVAPKRVHSVTKGREFVAKIETRERERDGRIKRIAELGNVDPAKRGAAIVEIVQELSEPTEHEPVAAYVKAYLA